MQRHGHFTPNRMTLLFILMASMMMLMGGAAVAPALPLISAAFPDVSETVVSLIITLPSLAIAVTGLGVGYLADRFGKVKVLAISLLIFTVAGSSGYYLDTMISILIGRFILGIGLAGISIAVTALIAEYYTGAQREKVIGFQSAAMGLGVLILETSGGLLAGIGWREPFLIYIVGMVIFLGVVIFMREPSRRETDIERVDPVTISKRVMAVCYLTMFLAMFLGFLLPTKLPYYLGNMGASALVSGIMLGFHGTCEAVVCLLHRRISRSVDRTVMLPLAFLLMGVGYCILYIPNSYIIVTASMALVGVGFGLVTPTLVGWLATMVHSGTSGKVMAGHSMSLNLGQFASSVIVAPVLVYAVTYENMFMIMGVFSILLFALYFFGFRASGSKGKAIS